MALLILQQAPEGLVRQAGLDRVHGPHALEALGDELLGDAASERVQALDLSGLDGERAVALPQPDVEQRAVDGGVLERAADAVPPGGALAVVRRCPRLRAGRQGRDRSPDGRGPAGFS